MSFQAYLDAVEAKTGKTPREIVELAQAKGFCDDRVKAADILAWLKSDFGLGRGHGMAMVHIITKGAAIDDKHVNSNRPHRDESATLWLDGVSTKPR